MSDVIAAMNQMRAWLADGTISLEEIMVIASEALDEIERTDRQTDPEFWMDAIAFSMRIAEKGGKDSPIHQQLKDTLRLKWLPVGLDIETLAEYVEILDMEPADRQALEKSLPVEKQETLIEVETARAMYQPPQDRNPGSITPEKVAAHPERYGSTVETPAADEYPSSSIAVLASLEPARKRPEGFITEPDPALVAFAQLVADKSDRDFVGRDRIGIEWDNRLDWIVQKKCGPRFVHDRKPEEIELIATVIAFSLAGHFQLEIKQDRELSRIDAAWYLRKDPVLLQRSLDAGALRSLRLSDLRPFAIEQDRRDALLTSINAELEDLMGEEPTEGMKP